MNDLKVLDKTNQTTNCEYEIFVPEQELVGKINATEIKFVDDSIKGLDDDILNIDFDESISKPDRKDYLIAGACGILSASLSLLWSKEFSFDEAHNWGNEKADGIVKEFAKNLGYKKDDLEGAIRFLEDKFPMAGDARTKEFGRGKQHHLRDFSHHPTPLGLICSIAMQFTGKDLGTDTQGNLIHVKVMKDGLIGKTFADKIAFGIINWFMHLISDFDGSSGSVLNGTGKGTGIPGPILSLLKELSALPMFAKVNEENINKPKVFSEYISKLFNGTLIKNENGEGIRFDFRTEMGIGHYIADQAKPVIINECLVRVCFFITRLIDEIEVKDIGSVSEINKLEPGQFLPFNNRALTRMITVSSGIFVAINISGTAVKAAIKSKGNKSAFCKEFFLSVNYVGIGRFVFACASDAEYIKEDVKEAYEKYIHDREGLHRNQYKFGYKFLCLDEEQLRILYSLKALAVEYDIQKTKDPKNQLIKKEWCNRWKKATLESFHIAESDYFMSAARVYEEIYAIDAESSSKGWLYLLTLELVLFQAYYSLDENDKNLFKGIRYSNRYLYEVFVKDQKLIVKKDLDNIVKTYKSYLSKLKESGKKVVLSVAATAGVTLATGGLALAFAPEIAVVLAGETVAGLSGAALTSASLAAIGGGSLAAGGLGMAGGTAILTGGGALLGLAGSGSASLVSVLKQTSEQYTLSECTKLLTFCKLVVVDKYHAFEMLNPIIAGIEECICQVEEERECLDSKTKEGKDSEKRMKSSLKYLKNCLKELDKLLVLEKEKMGGRRQFKFSIERVMY